MTDKQEKPQGAAARMVASLTPEQIAEMTPQQRAALGIPEPEPAPKPAKGKRA